MDKGSKKRQPHNIRMGQDQSRDGGPDMVEIRKNVQLGKEIAAQKRINDIQEELNLANHNMSELKKELQMAQNQSQATLSQIQSYQASEKGATREAALVGAQNKELTAQLTAKIQELATLNDSSNSSYKQLLEIQQKDLIDAKEETNAHKEELQILLEYQDKLQEALDKAIMSQGQKQEQGQEQKQSVNCHIIIHQRMDGSSAKELYIPDWRVAFFKSGNSIELIDDYDATVSTAPLTIDSTILYDSWQKFLESRAAFLSANSIFDKFTDLIDKQ